VRTFIIITLSTVSSIGASVSVVGAADLPRSLERDIERYERDVERAEEEIADAEAKLAEELQEAEADAVRDGDQELVAAIRAKRRQLLGDAGDGPDLTADPESAPADDEPLTFATAEGLTVDVAPRGETNTGVRLRPGRAIEIFVDPGARWALNKEHQAFHPLSGADIYGPQAQVGIPGDHYLMRLMIRIGGETVPVEEGVTYTGRGPVILFPFQARPYSVGECTVKIVPVQE